MRGRQQKITFMITGQSLKNVFTVAANVMASPIFKAMYSKAAGHFLAIA